MAIDFPNSPTLNQTHTVGSRIWTYNGYGWELDHSVLVDLGTTFVWPYYEDISNASITANAAGEGMGTVFRMPVAGALQGGQFRTATTTSGGTIDVRVETVDPTTGLNTGSLVAAGASCTVTLDAADDNVWKTYTLTTPPTLAKNDYVAIVVTAQAGVTVQLVSSNGSASYQNVLPYSLNNTAGTFSKDDAHPTHTILVDGVYVPVQGFYPYTNSTLSVASSTTPDEIGLKVVSPVSMRCDGVVVMIGSAGTGDTFTVKLYDSADTVLDSVSLDPRSFSSSAGKVQVLWAATHNLVGGETYRVTVQATGTTVTLTQITVGSSGLTHLLPGGGSCVKTSRTDSGAWTDDSTAYVYVVPLVGALLSRVDEV